MKSVVVGPVNIFELIRCNGDEAKIKSLRDKNREEWFNFATLSDIDKRRVNRFRELKRQDKFSLEPTENILDWTSRAKEFHLLETRVMSSLEQPQCTELKRVFDNLLLIGVKLCECIFFVDVCLRFNVYSFQQMFDYDFCFFDKLHHNIDVESPERLTVKLFRIVYGLFHFQQIIAAGRPFRFPFNSDFDYLRQRELTIKFFQNNYFKSLTFNTICRNFIQADGSTRESYRKQLEKSGCFYSIDVINIFFAAG